MLPNDIKHSNQATKIKCFKNMLPSVKKWYYQTKLPAYLNTKKEITILMLWIVTREQTNNKKLLQNAFKNKNHDIKISS